MEENVPNVPEKKSFFSLYETAEDLMKKVEEYFDKTPVQDQTRAGLCVFLGITRSTFHNWYKGVTRGDDFRDVCEWANTRLENKYELDLNHKNNPTGPIFALKQYGWKDSQEIEAKATGFEIVCNVPRPEEK